MIARAVDSLGIREAFLRQALQNSTPVKPTVISKGRLSTSNLGNRDDVAERSLITLLLHFPQIARYVFEDTDVRQWVGSSWWEVVDLIGADWQQHGKVDVGRIAQAFDSEKAAQIARLAIEGKTSPKLNPRRWLVTALPICDESICESKKEMRESRSVPRKNRKTRKQQERGY